MGLILESHVARTSYEDMGGPLNSCNKLMEQLHAKEVSSQVESNLCFHFKVVT